MSTWKLSLVLDQRAPLFMSLTESQSANTDDPLGRKKQQLISQWTTKTLKSQYNI